MIYATARAGEREIPAAQWTKTEAPEDMAASAHTQQWPLGKVHTKRQIAMNYHLKWNQYEHGCWDWNYLY